MVLSAAHTKLLRRGRLVVTSAANSLLLPLFNPLVSLLVVQLASPELWGEFVGLSIIAQLGAFVIGWGNKEFLLRAFGRNPTQISSAWQSSLFTRLVLLIGYFVVLALLQLPALQTLLLAVWCLALALDQSFEALVQYRRAFTAAVLIDLAGLAGLAGAVAWVGPRLTGTSLLALALISTLITTGLLALRFRHSVLQRGGGRFTAGYFQAALPFFLLGLSGLLQSRVDLYVASALLPRRELAHYQIYSNLLLYLQTLAALVLAPFVRSIYRLPPVAVRKLALRLFGLGLVGVVPALLLIDLVLRTLYGFVLPPTALLLGGLGVVPAFLYLPVIYALYRAERQAVVLAINTVGIVAGLLLSRLWLPAFGLAGGVAAAATAQWLMLLAYLVSVWLVIRETREDL